MPIEEIKPLSESNLYSVFAAYANLFASAQEKAESLATQAGVALPGDKAYYLGAASAWQTASWMMRRHVGGSGVVVDLAHIEKRGTALLKWMESMDDVIMAMPPLNIWREND